MRMIASWRAKREEQRASNQHRQQMASQRREKAREARQILHDPIMNPVGISAFWESLSPFRPQAGHDRLGESVWENPRKPGADF
jgi:hypothetical protein